MDRTDHLLEVSEPKTREWATALFRLYGFLPFLFMQILICADIVSNGKFHYFIHPIVWLLSVYCMCIAGLLAYSIIKDALRVFK